MREELTKFNISSRCCKIYLILYLGLKTVANQDFPRSPLMIAHRWVMEADRMIPSMQRRSDGVQCFVEPPPPKKESGLLNFLPGSWRYAETRVSVNRQRYDKILFQLDESTLHLLTPNHIGVRGDERADSAAKSAVDLTPNKSRIPYTDLKPTIDKFLHTKWQQQWSNNINSSKFSQPWESGDRHLENQEENMLLYPDCELVIQGLLTVTF